MGQRWARLGMKGGGPRGEIAGTLRSGFAVAACGRRALIGNDAADRSASFGRLVRRPPCGRRTLVLSAAPEEVRARPETKGGGPRGEIAGTLRKGFAVAACGRRAAPFGRRTLVLLASPKARAPNPFLRPAASALQKRRKKPSHVGLGSLAERKGFEPLVRLRAHTNSSRAP